MNGTLYRRRRRLAERFLEAAVYGAASVSVTLLLGIAGYVFARGAGGVSWDFLTSVTSSLEQTVGIGGNIINTIYLIVMTLLLAVPVGVGAAVYLNEYAKREKLVEMIEFATETLAGIPSVLYGMFGMAFFGEVLHLDYSLLRGALTLTWMVLPLIIRNSQEALRAVPESYRDAALGMGAGRWHLTGTILLPSAMPGILTGIVLSVGRIVGESAALLFTAGSGRLLPRLGTGMGEFLRGIGRKMTESGGTLTIELYLQMQNGKYDEAFAIGCVLIVMVFCINMIMKMAVFLCRNLPLHGKGVKIKWKTAKFR